MYQMPFENVRHCVEVGKELTKVVRVTINK